MNNVFTKEWTVFKGMEHVSEAWRFSDEIYEAAIRGDFRKAKVEQFFSIFKNQIRNEYGLVDICPGIPTDREVRVALWYIPTYTTIAMYVWFKNNNPGTFDEVFDRDMANLMEIAFKYGIPGKLYFGNRSGTWFNTGVAFYNQEDDYRTYMRLYKITWEQLLDLYH